jgi:hypothetical protein
MLFDDREQPLTRNWFSGRLPVLRMAATTITRSPCRPARTKHRASRVRLQWPDPSPNRSRLAGKAWSGAINTGNLATLIHKPCCPLVEVAISM